MEKMEIPGAKNEIIITDLERKFNKAEEVLNEYRVNMESFRDLYGDAVDRDAKSVEEIEAKYLRTYDKQDLEAQKIATVFEAIFCEHSELSNWLGENAMVAPTTKFDDYVNGVDAIAEFNEDEGRIQRHLGLGIDVTYSQFLKKKLLKIKEKIDNGKLSQIKYFHSDNMNFTGRLSGVPRVVVAVQKETVKNLAEAWDAGKMKELGSHFVQFQILEEIILQFEVYREYAQKIGQVEIVRKIDSLKSIISEIYEEKKTSIADTGQRDGSIEMIKDKLKEVFG
jgi:hypothetical protein